jgi:hypothetical protein
VLLTLSPALWYGYRLVHAPQALPPVVAPPPPPLRTPAPRTRLLVVEGYWEGVIAEEWPLIDRHPRVAVDRRQVAIAHTTHRWSSSSRSRRGTLLLRGLRTYPTVQWHGQTILAGDTTWCGQTIRVGDAIACSTRWWEGSLIVTEVRDE